MKAEIKIAPPNSLMLVMDHGVGCPPESMFRELVSSTPTCVAVGTRSEQDGETHIVLTDESSCEAPLNSILAFDGRIETSGGPVSIVDVLDRVLLSMNVSADKVRVRVWVNDQTEPDDIRVVVGSDNKK